MSLAFPSSFRLSYRITYTDLNSREIVCIPYKSLSVLWLGWESSFQGKSHAGVLRNFLKYWRHQLNTTEIERCFNLADSQEFAARTAFFTRLIRSPRVEAPLPTYRKRFMEPRQKPEIKNFISNLKINYACVQKLTAWSRNDSINEQWENQCAHILSGVFALQLCR